MSVDENQMRLEGELRDGQDTIDSLLRFQTGAGQSAAMTDIFTGANIMGTVPALKPNTNLNGYVFTTRPDLNLSPDNIRIARILHPLLTTKANSGFRAIANILSPQLNTRFPALQSSIVDPLYPFIACSDNVVKTLTGWPSPQLGINTAQAGIMKEEHIMVDSPALYNGQFSLNLSTYDIKGSYIMRLYFYWVMYISTVIKETFGAAPWPEYDFNGRLDYTTRIYRLIMDESNTYVEEIAACNYGIPQLPDIGPHFNYDSENIKAFVGQTNEIEFACTGAIYLDELLVRQFNNTVKLFNPSMRDGMREKYMVKIAKRYHKIFNFKVYPYIHPLTKELEWWCYRAVFDTFKPLIATADSLAPNYTLNSVFHTGG